MVDAEESERLALAAAQGKILLTLRSGADIDVVATRGVTPASLLAISGRPEARVPAAPVRGRVVAPREGPREGAARWSRSSAATCSSAATSSREAQVNAILVASSLALTLAGCAGRRRCPAGAPTLRIDRELGAVRELDAGGRAEPAAHALRGHRAGGRGRPDRGRPQGDHAEPGAPHRQGRGHHRPDPLEQGQRAARHRPPGEAERGGAAPAAQGALPQGERHGLRGRRPGGAGRAR